MPWTSEQIEHAARMLMEQHQVGRRFDGLTEPAPLTDALTAYAIQQAFVARKSRGLATQPAGYKIALTTPAMRSLVGYADSISGRVLASEIYPDAAQIQTRRYGRLAVEFEIAFLMRADLPARSAPWGRDIAEFVQRAHAALELVDDRDADYAALPHHILTLIADNAWNAGLVLGPALDDWNLQDLDQIEGVARVHGQEVGRGHGRDVLGHPLDALAWLANHLKAQGCSLRGGDWVTTGSLVKTQFPQAPCEVTLQLGENARVSARLV
jgi:2-keto-4-pentenoate hydratase